MSVSTTSGSREMFSADAICVRRVEVEMLSSGLKRNFEHREASGSIILERATSVTVLSVLGGGNVPSHIIAYQTESRYPRVVLHDSPQCCLRILGH